MKKILYLLLVVWIIIGVNDSYATTQWRGGTGDNVLLGTTTVSDIDAEIYDEITEPIDRMLAGYREGMKLKYNSVSTLDVTAGEVMVSNTAGTIRLMMRTTSTTNVTWSDIDTGAEASGTTYYVYAVASSSTATTATFKISTNSSTPSGSTYYKRLGQFTNDGSSNITAIQNDNDNVIVATGTVSNGGTISLPSGWAEDECDWTVGLGNANTSGPKGQSHPDGVTFQTTVSSSRVVTSTWNAINVADSAQSGGSTANYAIFCHR